MEKSLKNKILEKIKEGKVRMRPKIYFILKTISFFGLFVLFLFFSFLFFSFIHFYLISSGLWYLPQFGIKGFFVFLKYLPWTLIFFALFLFLILEIFTRKISFKWPILFSILGMIILLMVGSFLISKSNIHPNILLKAKEGRVSPFLSPIYLKYGMPKFKDFHRGVIEKISTSSVFIRKANDEVLEVKLEKLLPSPEKIEEGDSIVIFGKKENGKIRGKGIKKISDDFLPFEKKFLHQRWKMK